MTPLVDSELFSVMSRPRYLQTCSGPPQDTASSPSSSFANLSPESLFASPNLERVDISPVSVDRADLLRTIEWVPDHLMPLNRYIDCPERHEKVSFSLAIDTRCQEPFLDYLPCPGSGPLSAAGSDTSEYARQPGPAYIPSTPTPLLMAAAKPDRPTTPTCGAPIMMRRYLDDQEAYWISAVLERQSQSPNFQQERQIGNSLDQAPGQPTHLSISHHVDTESPCSPPRPSPRQCLGKRTIPDWNTADILTPDDEEEETNML